MAKLTVRKGTTSGIYHFFIPDATVTTGSGLTNLSCANASIIVRYISSGVATVSITLESIATLGTYSAPASALCMAFRPVAASVPFAGLYECHIHNDWLNPTTGKNLIVAIHGGNSAAPVFGEIQIDSWAVGVQKNTYLGNFSFFMRQSADHLTAATGLTVIDAARSIDGGAFASTTSAPTEISAGFYKLNLAAADVNGDVIDLKFTCASGADMTALTIKTSPPL